MPTVQLRSSDNQVFNVDIKVVQCSNIIRSMVEDLGIPEDEDEYLPLPGVNGSILTKILEWANHHKDDVPIPDDENSNDENPEIRTDYISEWDMQFLRVDNMTLIELIKAAGYLQIKRLVDVACKTVANMITGNGYGDF